MKPMGVLQKVDLREYWKDEARDFTPWLAQDENLQLLSNTIDLELELKGTEVFIGNYKADIVAEDLNSSYKVIIENQLEKTNHDHLGKIITYASGIEANIVIWISSKLTDEHRKAIDWLNEISDEDHAFFAIEMELWRINDSIPAPQFSVHCSPNDWAKLAKTPTRRKMLTETKELQLAFWNGLKEYMEEKGTILNLRKPRPQHWYPMAVGRSNFYISLTVNTRQSRLGCELYIKGEEAYNAFSQLSEKKDYIESEIGESLDWQELPEGQDCRIILYTDGNIQSESQWDQYHQWFKERAEKFYTIFSKQIRNI